MFRALLQMFRRLMSAPWRSQRYRPELHYMRGAGPATLASKASKALASKATDSRQTADHPADAGYSEPVQVRTAPRERVHADHV